MSRTGIYDIHCHIVPGVDDGASDYEDTKKLLRMEYDQGVRNIIATPHFRFRMFETPLSRVQEQFLLVQKAAAEIGDDLQVYLGCEFHANMEMYRMLREGEVSTMAGSRYVLAEFSESSEGSYIRERLNKLISSGYKLNADSIVGKEGFSTKRYCRKLMKYDLVKFVGSDCHNTRSRISRMGEAYDYVAKKMGEAYADHLFIENPRRILEDAKRRKER